MYIPNKITVRLDRINNQLLTRYLEKYMYKTASQVIRAALRQYLDAELRALSMDAPPPPPAERPLEDKFAASTKKGGQ